MPRPKASRAPAMSSSSSASIPRAPASALPSISGSPGAAARASAMKRSISARIPPQRVHLGAEDERDGAGRAQAEPGARGQRGLGVAFGLVELEAEHGRRGELQVDDRAGAGRAEFGGDAPRLRQAVGARVVEHVDRAELVQSPQPPHGQPGRVGRGQGLLEGVPGAIQVACPADPAEQFQRPAADLGARPRRGQDALGEGTRPVARVVGGQGDLGVQHGRLGAETGLGVGRRAGRPRCRRAAARPPTGSHPPPRGPASGGSPPGGGRRHHPA